MPVSIEKEWAAVDDDEIIHTEDTEAEVRAALNKQGLDPDDYEIVALPKSHSSMFV